MSQKEITNKVDLLDKNGNITTYGWAKHNFFNYDRSLTKPRSSVKEWDFYSFTDGKFYVVVALFNITLAACPMISIFDLENKTRIGQGPLKLFAKNKCLLPQTSDKPTVFEASAGNSYVKFETLKDCKNIYYKSTGKKPIEASFKIYVNENQEGITTVTPFEKKNQFFLASKFFGVPAEGELKVDGKLLHSFSKENSFGIMDWGKGVWPHTAVWYWANGNKYIDGKPFSFNFTWAINDKTPDLETVLYYDGKINKIGEVYVEEFPKTKGFMKDWHIKSKDGRFDAVMKPFFDNSSKKILGILGQAVDQVFGYWTGYAILDDGTKIEFTDMVAFCEYVESTW